MSKRSVLVVVHTGRPEAIRSAQLVIERLSEAGICVRVLDDEAAAIGGSGVQVMPSTAAEADDAEVVMVLGGDGTLLRAADLTRTSGTPLLGVNLGHVGFLAEAEREDLAATVDRVVERRYDVEERMTIDVTARRNGTVMGTTWALNEATIEKGERERMLEVVAEIDGRPLSNWGCDGVVCATPTGSTKTRSVKESQLSGLSLSRAGGRGTVPSSLVTRTFGPAAPSIRKAEAAPGPPLNRKVTGRFALSAPSAR